MADELFGYDADFYLWSQHQAALLRERALTELDIENLAADKNYYARVRFGIDTDELPLPLQSSWFWHSDWDLQSEWYEWEVKRSAL